MAKGHEGDSNIAKWDLSFVVYAAKVLGFITNLSVNTKNSCYKLVSSYFRNTFIMTIDHNELQK